MMQRRPYHLLTFFVSTFRGYEYLLLNTLFS